MRSRVELRDQAFVGLEGLLGEIGVEPRDLLRFRDEGLVGGAREFGLRFETQESDDDDEDAIGLDDWLQSHDVEDVVVVGIATDHCVRATALDAAGGHPGLAAAWLAGDGLALRRSVADDAGALQRGQAEAMDVARRWVADGRAGERLAHLAELAVRQAASLTDAAATRRLAARFDAANRARELLRSTVRADLAVAESLLPWCRTQDGGGRAT